MYGYHFLFTESIPKLIDVQSMVSLAVKGQITSHACSILIREKVQPSSDFLLSDPLKMSFPAFCLGEECSNIFNRVLHVILFIYFKLTKTIKSTKMQNVTVSERNEENT